MNIIRRLSAVMRGTGRTERALVGFLTSPDAIFVTATEHQAEEFRRKFANVGRHRFTSLGQVERETRGRRVPIIFDHTAVEFELDKLHEIIQEQRVAVKAWEDYLKQHGYNPTGLYRTLSEARRQRREQRPQLVPYLTDIELIDAMQDMYDSEINFSMESFWQHGFMVALGDKLNRFLEESTEETYLDALRWLVDAALRHYPKSTFAKKWKIPQFPEDLAP